MVAITSPAFKENAARALADPGLQKALGTAKGAFLQRRAQAVANLTALCRAHLPGRHRIEVVDVFREPGRALADHILLTPTLIALAPLPVRRIVGTLSQTQPVLEALGLSPAAA